MRHKTAVVVVMVYVARESKQPTCESEASPFQPLLASSSSQNLESTPHTHVCGCASTLGLIPPTILHWVKKAKRGTYERVAGSILRRGRE